VRWLPLLIAASLSCARVSDGAGGARPSDGPVFGEVQRGDGTYYLEANGDGACMFGPSPDDLDVAANGTVRVRIVDLCPECLAGDLDLSPQAFDQIAPRALGRVPIEWQLEACGVSGNVRYHIKDGSSQWWTAIQVRNHRLPIARLEWLSDGAWSELPRQTYNYFVAQSGTGPGALRVRITAWDGQVLEDELPGPDAEATYEGSGQFQ
jgi:expansin (peptidoglycan-binding protein)